MSTTISYERLKYEKLLFVLITILFFGFIFRGIVPVNFEFVLGILLFVGLYVTWMNRFNSIDKSILIWIGVVFFYWLTSFIASIYHSPLGDRGWSVLNVVHAIFPFLFLLLTLYFLKPSIDFFWYVLGTAALFTVFLFALEAYSLNWDKLMNFKHISDDLRLGKAYSHPVKLGVMGNMFFIILLGALPWAYKKGKVLFVFLSILLILLLVGVILTQTRTAWMGWPEAIVGWGIFYFYVFKRNLASTLLSKFLLLLLPLITLMLILNMLPANKIFVERMGLIYSDIEKYSAGEEFQTSLGRRLLSYEAAILEIEKSYWFGIGEDNFETFQKEKTQALAREKFKQEFSGFEFTHIHNQFLMSWLTKGFFAFLSVVLIFVFLIWHFTRGLKNATFENKPIWIAGLVFSVASLLSFMPETPLQYSSTSTRFFLLATLLVVFSILTEERQNKMLIEKSGMQDG